MGTSAAVFIAPTLLCSPRLPLPGCSPRLPLPRRSQPACMRHSCERRNLFCAARAARGSSAALSRPGPLPEPTAYQQTLRRPFALGGIGLHTGEYALVRVLPAFAGDGRYFVHVPLGTNSRHWALEQPEVQDLKEASAGAKLMKDGGEDGLHAKLFFEFLEKEDTGIASGSFADYLQQRRSLSPDTLLIEAESELLEEEQPSWGQPGEARLQAHVGNLQQGHRWCMVLARGDSAVWGAEHLLAALECCGVDDARIEIEGGKEVPIVDGSALGWATEVQRAGLRAAPAAASSDAVVPRRTHSLCQEVTVRDGEAFITYYPGPSARVSVGVDCSAAAPVVGRQWFTWSPEDPGHHGKDHFCVALAPARTCYPSAETVEALMAVGLLQGGPDYVSLIGNKDDWMDATMVRFPSDEPARHAAVDLLGDLSLLAGKGGRGLPAGHIVAYQPSHALQAKFVHTLHLAIADGVAR